MPPTAPTPSPAPPCSPWPRRHPAHRSRVVEVAHGVPFTDVLDARQLAGACLSSAVTTAPGRPGRPLAALPVSALALRAQRPGPRRGGRPAAGRERLPGGTDGRAHGIPRGGVRRAVRTLPQRAAGTRHRGARTSHRGPTPAPGSPADRPRRPAGAPAPTPTAPPASWHRSSTGSRASSRRTWRVAVPSGIGRGRRMTSAATGPASAAGRLAGLPGAGPRGAAARADRPRRVGLPRGRRPRPGGPRRARRRGRRGLSAPGPSPRGAAPLRPAGPSGPDARGHPFTHPARHAVQWCVVDRTGLRAEPSRTCVGCRGSDSWSALLRVVAVTDAASPGQHGPVLLRPDPRHRLPGRGAGCTRDPPASSWQCAARRSDEPCTCRPRSTSRRSASTSGRSTSTSPWKACRPTMHQKSQRTTRRVETL